MGAKTFTIKELQKLPDDRAWLRDQGLMRADGKDEFKSCATFQECIRIGLKIGYERGFQDGQESIGNGKSG